MQPASTKGRSWNQIVEVQIFQKKEQTNLFFYPYSCSTNERNWILIGHVIFELFYNQIYQLKTFLYSTKFMNKIMEF